MKKAPSIKLSLRKLLVAMLAVGPLAILPSPVWAALPTTSSFTVTNGSGVTVTPSGSTAIITAPNDRTVLVWGSGNFNIPSTDTWTFSIPSGGAILNKVGYTTTGTLAAADTATIGGILSSNGKVFVLANGNIVVNGGAQLNATGGVVLSTLTESSDFTFTTTGNLGALNSAGASAAGVGNITLGNNTTNVSVTGNLSVWSGNTITINTLTVSGDLLLQETLAGTALTAAGNISVPNGNLTITTNGTAGIASSNVVTVPNGTTTITTGNGFVNLGNTSNDFKTLILAVGNGTGGCVTVSDANNLVLGGGSVGQDLVVGTVNNLTTSGAVAVLGNTTLTTSGAGNITFASGSSSGNTITATTNNGPLTINTAGNLTIGAITAGGAGAASITTANVATINGTITAAGNNTTVAGASINSTATGFVNTVSAIFNSSAGGIVLPAVSTTSAATGVLATATGGSITQNASTILTTANLSNSTFSAAGNNVTIGNNNVLSNATLTLTGNNISVGNSKNVVIGSTNATGNLTINTSYSGTAGTGAVTLGAGAGTVAGLITVGGVETITTNAANVTDDSYVTQRIFGNVSINTTAGTAAGAAVTLNAAAANPAGTSVATFGGITVVAGTAGNVTISETGGMNLQGVTGNALSFRTTGSNDILINGPITSGSSTVTFNAASGNISINNTVTTGAGATTFNTASSGGSIVETSGGNLNIGSGGSVFNLTNTTGTLNLSNTSNSLGGSTQLINGGNITVVASSNILLASSTNSTSSNVSLTTVGATNNQITINSGNIATVSAVSAGNVVLAGGTYKNITVNASETGANAITQTANISVNGTLTLIAPNGNVAMAGTSAITSNITGSVVFGGVGNATVSSTRNLTASGSVSGNAVLTAGSSTANNATASFANTWTLTLGNLTAGNLVAEASNGFAAPTVGGTVATTATAATGGNSGSIVQSSGSILHVENTADFITLNGNIVIANNANSAGRVNFQTGGGTLTAPAQGSSSVTYVEDSGVKLGNLFTNGAASISSRFSGVVEDATGTATSMNVTGSSSSLSISAPNGSISLGNLTTGAATVGNSTNVSLTASGSAAFITTTGNIALGNTAANSLFVSAGNRITQTGAANIFGSANFVAAGNITLNNTSNNFGPVLVNATGAEVDITVVESGTLNLRTVTVQGSSTGNFSATSVNGDIISTGFGGVKPGGNFTGSTPNYGNGTVTLAATNGNISVGDATTDFPTTGGIIFNAKNVTLSVLGQANLTLGSNTTASSAGNLTITSATGNVLNAGNLSVTGAASIQTGTGNITLNQSGNQFGTLKFLGNQVNVSQTGDLKLVTGSSALGAAQFASTGNVSIVNSGGLVSFGNVVSIVANGNITLPKLIQAAGTVTVNAAGTKDLSKLSVSGDLNSMTPVNLGTGAYNAPQP